MPDPDLEISGGGGGGHRPKNFLTHKATVLFTK